MKNDEIFNKLIHQVLVHSGPQTYQEYSSPTIVLKGFQIFFQKNNNNRNKQAHFHWKVGNDPFLIHLIRHQNREVKCPFRPALRGRFSFANLVL